MPPPQGRHGASAKGGARPPGPPPGGARAYTLRGAYTVDAAVPAPERARHYPADAADVSSIWVRQRGVLQLLDAQIDKHGDSSSHENSSFYGLNAAVLVTADGQLRMHGGQIVANGIGANAVSVADAASQATLEQVRITAHGVGAHGVDATRGGHLQLRQVQIETFDESAAAVATDRGGGTIQVEGGRLLSHGYRSPGLYSTGDIRIRGVQVQATGAEAAVIEGSNRIEVIDSDLRAARERGAMLYQSFSGDAHGQLSVYVQHGGSFHAQQGPLFYVTNTQGQIVLENVALTADSGVLIKAAAGQWGTPGRNGGQALVQANRQTLPGDVVAADGGSVSLELTTQSTLHGRSEGASLSLDASSRWIVTGDSRVAGLTLAGTTPQEKLAHIDSQGHEIRYDPRQPGNRWLGGKRWELPGGGHLSPQG